MINGVVGERRGTVLRLAGHIEAPLSFPSVEAWLAQPTKFYNATGLHLETFTQLCAWMRKNTELDDTQIRLEEKVMLFLHVCRKVSMGKPK